MKSVVYLLKELFICSLLSLILVFCKNQGTLEGPVIAVTIIGIFYMVFDVLHAFVPELFNKEKK